jgi:hypothetical protein
MAQLIECKTCSASVSSNANFCVKCGGKMNAVNASRIGRVLLWCFAVMIGITTIAAFVGQSDFKATAQTAAQKNESDRMNLGVAAARVTKAAMRNPDSFVLEHAYVSEQLVACLEYRAQNGFGGMNRMRVIVVHNPPELVQDDDSAKFASRWSSDCLTKSRDMTAEVRARI